MVGAIPKIDLPHYENLFLTNIAPYLFRAFFHPFVNLKKENVLFP